MSGKEAILWTSTEAAAVMGGISEGAWHATGVSINMESLRPGDLYFATRDDDLEQVFAKGAGAAVIAGGTGSDLPWPVLKVRDVFGALQTLAAAARYRTHGTIIAIQGKRARQAAGAVLAKAGRLHEGGRHVSLGLANLPEDVDYGLFALSPAVRPDIAVISDCADHGGDALFATMPASGGVIINGDDERHVAVAARAKAAGIKNIFICGMVAGADARIRERINAGNGCRIRANIAGEELSFLLPHAFDCGGVMAALLVLKLTGKPLAPALQAFESAYRLIASFESVTLIEPAQREKNAEKAQAVFKIRNMIDWGFGRQTAVLDNLAGAGRAGLSFTAGDFSIPDRKERIDFVYTGRKPGAVPNARTAIAQKYKNLALEPIAPDVLVPGDFLVFREIWHSSKAVFSEALRLIPDRKMKKPNAL
jgi:hypothetical protein